MQCQTLIYLHNQDISVPCGKCAFCGATKRSDWALRLHYEARQHAVKNFITLTYNDQHLHWKDGQSQLDKRDIQLWMKRLRKSGAKVRYFAVGEYGSKTYRPHYHVLLFGEYTIDQVRAAWRDDKGEIGHVHVGEINDKSVMYCLGYIINGKGWKMRHRRVAPFSLMSRRPGIGANYLTPAMVAWHKSGRKNYAMLNTERRHLPRYYKCKIFSKIDLVRIAVRDQKSVFKAMVRWVRSPAMQKQRDPLAYRDEQIKILARKIRAKCKENLII